LWCIPQPVWFNRVDDPERPFLSFLNVRWVLVPGDWRPPPDWRTLAEGDGTKLVENPRALERVFAPRLVRAEATDGAALGALASINDFGEHGVVDGRGVAWAAGEWRTNGKVTVKIESYRPQSLELSVDAESSAVIGTSIPRWPGWKLEIDGESAPLFAYNRAFLGFEVPAGSRRAVLRYRPDGFVWGAAVTGATLAGCLMTPFVRRRLRARFEDGAPPAQKGP
ncbi:MAG: YfhO family protein, partial [Acidobacteriota bacterium]|nr:YfhO family protein [Acidobacteriota bacterium]